MAITLQSSPTFRRAVLIAALAVVMAEVGLFAVLWRIGNGVDLETDRRAALLFVVLGSALTLQAMAVAGVAWVMVAMSRTVLHDDVTGLTLEHPWRRWQGRWSEVTHAWTQGGWLVLQVQGQWRRWYVRAASDQAVAFELVRARLATGAWLDGSARRRHLARTTLPMLLATTGIAGLILVGVLRALNP